VNEEDIARHGKAVAAVIKTTREAAGLSKNALGQKAGISVQTVSFIESGTNSPSISTFLRICHALGKRPDLLLKEALGD
jgi:uncharacterized protein